MWISRVRVDGGYLAGLDISLARGLNVIVGPRGAGKTTLLELIRHALGIEHADQAVAKRQRDAVRQLLGSGEVILEIQHDHGSVHLVVDAKGGGRVPEVSNTALALGQNELERIASSASSRLNLIDLRATLNSNAPALDHAAFLTERIAVLRLEQETNEDYAARRALLIEERSALSAEEYRLMQDLNADLADKRETLRRLEHEFLQVGAQLATANETLKGIVTAQDALASASAAIDRLESRNNTLDIAATVHPFVERLQSRAKDQKGDLRELAAAVEATTATLRRQQDQARVASEPIRSELEAAETGLGQVTAKLRNINAELQNLDALEILSLERSAEIDRLLAARNGSFDQVETWQEEVLIARKAVAATVTDDLDSNVSVAISHLGNTERFASELQELLQGSGLQYRSATEKISTSVLPRQLIEFIEAEDLQGFAAATELAQERAARILSHLGTPDRLARLALIVLEDRVDYHLRDGASYRSVEHLSTGQKCAVTLPVVLTERERILLLDQPEDHLDNAYLVSNIVSALASRSHHGAQTIVATHNANIPVLGSAPAVVALDSDGVNGHIDVAGPFDREDVVSRITSLMEGGHDAFRRRAEFYAEHPGVDDEA